jgi:phosphatidylserine decarboxylase
MTTETGSSFGAQYQNLFGVVAGYLPRDPSALHEWHGNLQAELESEAAPKAYSPAVLEFLNLINSDGIVRMYVDRMIEESHDLQRQHGAPVTIRDRYEMLDALNRIRQTAPLYDPDPNRRNAFPMSSLFAYMMATPAGFAAFRDQRINEAIRRILKEWCAFLDGPESQAVLNEGPTGWLSEAAVREFKLREDFVIPNPGAPAWGWRSYNDWFHRQVKADRRPIASPGDPRVVVSANDGTMWSIQREVPARDDFWLKAQPYSLTDMLDDRYVDRFIGGDVFQSFLSGANYHRFRSPIDGVVRDVRIVNQLLFTEAESAGFDPHAGVLSLGYDAAVNTRGLAFIESPIETIGMVCVIPVGITEISSVTWTVRPGQQVRKGDELGWFSYGGSTLAIVFQPRAIDRFTVPSPQEGQDPATIQVNAQIAVAR